MIQWRQRIEDGEDSFTSYVQQGAPSRFGLCHGHRYVNDHHNVFGHIHNWTHIPGPTISVRLGVNQSLAVARIQSKFLTAIAFAFQSEVWQKSNNFKSCDRLSTQDHTGADITSPTLLHVRVCATYMYMIHCTTVINAVHFSHELHLLQYSSIVRTAYLNPTSLYNCLP